VRVVDPGGGGENFYLNGRYGVLPMGGGKYSWSGKKGFSPKMIVLQRENCTTLKRTITKNTDGLRDCSEEERRKVQGKKIFFLLSFLHKNSPEDKKASTEKNRPGVTLTHTQGDVTL